MIVPLALGAGLFFGGVWLLGKLKGRGIPFSPSAMRGQVVQGIEQNPPASSLPLPPEDTWVPLTIDGIDYLVSPTYLAPVGIGEAIDITNAHGLVLPTPRMVDAIWQAADLKLDPHPQQHDGTISSMNARDLTDRQNEYIENQIDGRSFKLLAGTHKDVVFIDSAFGRQVNKPGIYGWHRLNGTPIQSAMWGHALAWKDYSQGLRLIKKL